MTTSFSPLDLSTTIAGFIVTLRYSMNSAIVRLAIRKKEMSETGSHRYSIAAPASSKRSTHAFLQSQS